MYERVASGGSRPSADKRCKLSGKCSYAEIVIRLDGAAGERAKKFRILIVPKIAATSRHVIRNDSGGWINASHMMYMYVMYTCARERLNEAIMKRVIGKWLVFRDYLSRPSARRVSEMETLWQRTSNAKVLLFFRFSRIDRGGRQVYGNEKFFSASFDIGRISLRFAESGNYLAVGQGTCIWDSMNRRGIDSDFR